MPAVSVVIPSYNMGNYIGEAISSVLQQTYRDFEIIVVDDGSTDDTERIINRYNGNIRYIKQSNSGPAQARNLGIQHARGDFVSLLDADDLFIKNKLELQMKHLEKHPDIGILGGGCLLIDDIGQRLGKMNAPQEDLKIRWVALLSNPFLHSTILVNHAVLKESGFQYESDYCPTEDYELFSKLLLITKAQNLPYPLSCYRIQRKSLTSVQNEKRIQNHLRVSCRNASKFGLSQEAFTQLSKAMAFGKEAYDSLSISRSTLTTDYLDLWDNFRKTFKFNSELDLVETFVLLRSLQMLLYPPLPPGWAAILPRFIQRNPLLFFKILGAIPNLIANSLGQNASKKIRKGN